MSHKPGPLKQHNKPFKGKSKGTRRLDGKVEKQQRPTVKSQHEKTKAERRGKKKAELKAQRERERSARRGDGAPRLVVIVSFSDSASADVVKASLVGYCGQVDGAGPVTVNTVPGSKQRFTFVTVRARDTLQVLEACLVADVLMPVVDASEGVGAAGVRLASAIKAQGLPAVLPVVTDITEVARKNRHAAKKGLLEDLQFLFPNTARVMTLEEGVADSQQIFRFLDSMRLQELHYLEHRSVVLAEAVRVEAQPVDAAAAAAAAAEGRTLEPLCTLFVTGVVRGGASALSADQLVHVVGCGDYQLERVWNATTQQVISQASAARPAASSENTPDAFGESEQTWPTAAEVHMAGNDSDGNGNGSDGDDGPVLEVRRRRRVPKGVSEYQAAWLSDDEDKNDDDADSNGDGDEKGPRAMESGDDDDEGSAELGGGMSVEDDAEGADALDAQDEEKQREKDHQQWPDEKEVPGDVPARERFAAYRGLDSFRSAVWDAKENLPADYARIYQLQQYAAFVRRNTAAAHAVVVNAASPGQLVTLEIIGVPLRWTTTLHPSKPLVVGSLLKHENKTSVLHFDLMRVAGFTEPLPSKEELVFVFGLRRVAVAPLFSQHVAGCDKCKYERFLPQVGTSMATFYGPVTYTPCTVVVFKRGADGTLMQVATGSLRTVNADLLIIKKIILTAHPCKIHKRTALCRGMFHEPDDVRWFKPVSVWTKYGRIGHIRESNGTKGDFKAVFDGQLNSVCEVWVIVWVFLCRLTCVAPAQADTVCLSLYKRIFPSQAQWCKEIE